MQHATPNATMAPHTATKPTMTSSVDEDLAHATSLSLTMGASVVTNVQTPSYVIPSKLHPSLYNNSLLSDVSMMTLTASLSKLSSSNINDDNNNINILSPRTEVGVPGFPDFPDCWMGEPSKKRNPSKKWKINTAKAKRQQRRAVQKAVNHAGIIGNQIKKRQNIEQRMGRRVRRQEKVALLKKRSERKRAMGSICRGLSSLKCD